MPDWLRNQLMRAFQKRDARKIKLLNDCWFFYSAKSYDTATKNASHPQSSLH